MNIKVSQPLMESILLGIIVIAFMVLGYVSREFALDLQANFFLLHEKSISLTI